MEVRQCDVCSCTPFTKEGFYAKHFLHQLPSINQSMNITYIACPSPVKTNHQNTKKKVDKKWLLEVILTFKLNNLTTTTTTTTATTPFLQDIRVLPRFESSFCRVAKRQKPLRCRRYSCGPESGGINPRWGGPFGVRDWCVQLLAKSGFPTTDSSAFLPTFLMIPRFLMTLPIWREWYANRSMTSCIPGGLRHHEFWLLQMYQILRRHHKCGQCWSCLTAPEAQRQMVKQLQLQVFSLYQGWLGQVKGP